MYLGIDIGSTTIKTVLCDRNGDILYSDYRRHNTDITATPQPIPLRRKRTAHPARLERMVRTWSRSG